MKGKLKYICLILLLILMQYGRAQLTFTINNVTGSNSITCATPTINLLANSPSGPPVSYTWAGSSAIYTGSNVLVTNSGNYTITAKAGTNTATQLITIGINTTVPVASIGSTFIVTGTNAGVPITIVAISPTINITHIIYEPLGGTVTAFQTTFIYMPGTLGIYTYCLMNNTNGCATCYSPGGPYVPGSPGTYTTGISESNTAQTVSILPIPSTGEFEISLQNLDAGTIEIYSMSGELVLKQAVNGKLNRADLRDKNNGIYFIKITCAQGQTMIRKVIKVGL